MLRVYLKPLSPWYDNPPYHIYYHFTLYTHTYIHTYQIWLVSIKERRVGGRQGIQTTELITLMLNLGVAFSILRSLGFHLVRWRVKAQPILSTRSWGSNPSLLSGFITIVSGVHIIWYQSFGSKISLTIFYFRFFYFLFPAVEKRRKVIPVRKFPLFNLVSHLIHVPDFLMSFGCFSFLNCC